MRPGMKAGDIRLRNVPPEKPFPKKKSRLSKAARARMSQAQKARWAKVKNPMKFEFNQDKREWKDVTPGTSSANQGVNANIYLTPEMFEAAKKEYDAARRTVETETHKVQPGKGTAFSSKQCLFYHDIPPELLKRIAQRYTGGHKKYNNDPVPITMNLNWRIGLDDPLYVMDRLNHMFEHMVDFLENGNTNDDNLGAIGWCCGFLMEAERLHPEVLNQVLQQSRYSGKEADTKKSVLQELQK